MDAVDDLIHAQDWPPPHRENDRRNPVADIVVNSFVQRWNNHLSG